MEFGFGHLITESTHRHVELVQVAETLGFDYAWVPDQTFYPDPYLILGAMANATKHIQLGVGVTNPYTRHPAMSARAIATLDQISNGRAHLGIGAGNRKELLYPLGYDGAHAGGLCKEMVEAIHCLLSNRICNYQGKYFQVENVPMDFETRSDIQLYIAGRGPIVLQAAGEVADGVIVGALCTNNGISYAMRQVEIGAKKADRELQNIQVISWVTCQLTDDRSAVMEATRPTIAHIIGGAPDSVLEAIGLDMDRVKRLKDVYINEGIPQAAELVTNEFVDALTLIGNGEEVSARIRLLEAAGVTQISILLPGGGVDQHIDRLSLFADSIFPSFK